MDRPVLDFMSDEFLAIQHACHAGVKRVLKTDQTLYMYNASGHGAWEAALANLFSAGDTVLIVETGYFSQSWAEMAVNLGIKVETFAADWRKGADHRDWFARWGPTHRAAKASRWRSCHAAG